MYPYTMPEAMPIIYSVVPQPIPTQPIPIDEHTDSDNTPQIPPPSSDTPPMVNPYVYMVYPDMYEYNPDQTQQIQYTEQVSSPRISNTRIKKCIIFYI